MGKIEPSIFKQVFLGTCTSDQSLSILGLEKSLFQFCANLTHHYVLNLQCILIWFRSPNSWYHVHCLLSKSFPPSICPTLFYSFYVWIVKKILIQLFELMNNFSFFNFWEIMMKRVWWVGIEAIFLHFDRTLGKWDRTWKWGLIYIKVILLSQCIPFPKVFHEIVAFQARTKFANVYILTTIWQRNLWIGNHE